MSTQTIESGTEWPPGVQPPEGLPTTPIRTVVDVAEDNAAGLCECGCGEAAPIASQSNTRAGHVKGQPMRFVLGHHGRTDAMRKLMSERRRAAGNEALRGRKRGTDVGAKVSASKRGIPNDSARGVPRDGDKNQARRRIRLLVRLGTLPRAIDVPCTDCRRMWRPGDALHGYDHYLGYAAEHHEVVEPVCIPCHNRREFRRRMAVELLPLAVAR